MSESIFNDIRAGRDPFAEEDEDANRYSETSNGTAGRAPPRVRITKASAYKTMIAEYLPGFAYLIPQGMTTIIAGEPGHGKSMLVCHIAAKEAKRGRVALIAAAEDSINHTLKPRLMAEGLTEEQMGLVRFVEYEDAGEDAQLRLPDHVHLLEEALEELANEDCTPSVLLIDPIGSFMGKSIDSWKASDVRQALGPFKTIAERYDLAIVLVAHISKGTGTNLSNRLQDSSAFGQVARSILFLGLDPDDPEGKTGDQRVLASFKLSIGKKPGATAYRMVPMLIEHGDQRVESARIERVGPSNHNAHALLAYASQHDGPKREYDAPKRDEAEDFLLSLLADGPLGHKDVAAAAEANSIGEKSLRAARQRVGVIIEHDGYPRVTTWRLP